MLRVEREELKNTDLLLIQNETICDNLFLADTPL